MVAREMFEIAIYYAPMETSAMMFLTDMTKIKVMPASFFVFSCGAGSLEKYCLSPYVMCCIFSLSRNVLN